jgi:hypothetical protein
VDLHLPPDISAGEYPLLLTAPAENAPMTLGQVSLANRPRQFGAPAIAQVREITFGDTVRLLGVDEPAKIPASPGQTITVTLVWQALGTPPRDLVRFVHMLGPDSKPLAQEDSVPCAGACSALSWLPGEILVDQARLTIPAGLAAGQYRLAAGWYDATTFQRIPIGDATRPDTAEDVAILPSEIVVSH